MSNGETFLLSTSEPNYDPLHNVGRTLIDAAAQLNAAVDERARAFGITGAQWTVLIRIGGGVATTASELCQSIGHDSGSMTRMLDRLEKLGLIRRSPSSKDGRALSLSLTREGERLYPDLRPIAVEVLDRHLSGFTPQEIEQLIGLLERLITNGRAAGRQCGQHV